MLKDKLGRRKVLKKISNAGASLAIIGGMTSTAAAARGAVIENVNSGLVLQVANASLKNGANVTQGVDDEEAHQRWDTTRLGDHPVSGLPMFEITNMHSGKALEVDGHGLDNGDNIQQWDSTGNDNQVWVGERFSGTLEWKYENYNSYRSMEVDGWSESDDANVQQWGWHGGDNQKWRFY